MTKTIRLGVAAAAALAFLPAWGSDASQDKREIEQSQQQPADTSAPAALPQDSVTQELQPSADQGSGGGEPAYKRDADKRQEQRDAAREQFLNEVWSAP